MDNNSCTNKEQQAQTRVELLQAAWPTGDVAMPGTIAWGDRIKASISRLTQTNLFSVATILLIIAAVPAVLISPLCPVIWTAIGLRIIYAQSRKNNGEIGRLGFVFMMVGQYIGFVLSILGALVAFCVVVEGCTALGQTYENLQDILFWVSAATLIITFLLAGYRWKVLCAAKTIKEAYEGTSNNGVIPYGAIVECFVLGLIACLTVVGIFAGIASILIGVALVRYNKAMDQIELDMMEQDLAKAERLEIMPTWKQFESNS